MRFFEFGDRPWLPDTLRVGITDYLQYAANKADIYNPVVPILRGKIESLQERTIIDLCSGSGGGMLSIYQKLKDSGTSVRIILTDKFPNKDSYKILEESTDGDVTFVDHPVDALDIPDNLQGFRTMFVSFHHFNREQAVKILASASAKGVPIGVFEVTERTLTNFVAMMFSPLAVLAVVPFIRPFSFSRFFFTYVIPVIPFFVMWDGMVSVLNTYSIDEMAQMTSEVQADDYVWEIGRVKGGRLPAILYLIGTPVKKS